MASVKTLGEIEDWEKFLDSNYHQMSRRIRVENLLDRLRSQRVISQEDQETVLHKYCTQFLKTGLLIDIVKSKGRHGFEKFMESVEYEYPEVYLETTGITPRKDDNAVTAGDRRQTSMLLIGKMADLIGTFTTHVEEKKTEIQKKENELKEFQELVAQLKVDLQKQSDEQKMMEDEMKEMNNCVQELRSEKKKLMEELKKERMERQQLDMEFSSMRREKLKTLYETTNNHPPLNQSLSLNSPIQGEGKTKDLFKETGQNKSKDTNSDLESNLAQLQESNNRLHICLEEFKKESERCRMEQDNAETETKTFRLENEKMKEELKKLEDQCKRMADIIRTLKEEIDTNKGKTDTGLEFPIIFGGMNSLDGDKIKPDSPEAESSNQTKTHFKRRPAKLDPKRRQNPTP